MLKIFRWTCLFLHFYMVLCKPYSILRWYKVNEKMKQQREQKRRWKLKSEFCIVWKSSFGEGKKHKNETLRPATNATKSPKNVLIPPIKPTLESIRVLLATSKTFAMCLLVDKQRCSWGPLRKQQYDQKHESVGESTLVENSESRSF